MANTEKKKKHKHNYTEMHPSETCHVKGCGHPIKASVVERTPGKNYTCYLHGLMEQGKTHSHGVPIKDLLRIQNRRMTENK